MLVLEEKAGAGVDAGDNIILRPYIQSRVNNRNYKYRSFTVLSQLPLYNFSSPLNSFVRRAAVSLHEPQ